MTRKFERKLMLIIRVESFVLTNFRLCSSESFKKCEVIPQKY